MNIDENVAARFWPKVRVAGEGCWLWTAATVPAGYGSIDVGGRQHGAHRVSWAMANGRWPEGMILHRCGVHRCVRPDHLYEGTGSQNSEDARRHGTLPVGEHHANAKLTDGEVAAIRHRYASGEAQVSIARDYPVTQAQVSNIVRGIQRGTWEPVRAGARERYRSSCEQCGGEFFRKPGGRKKRFCSKACQSSAQAKGHLRACPVCGTGFRRPPSAKGETCSYACMGKLRSMRLRRP